MSESQTVPRCPPIWIGFVLTALCFIGEFGETIGIPLPVLGVKADRGAVILALFLVSIIFWFFCVGRIHSTLYEATEERYSTIPFEAIAFHLIPLFNLYWMVKWPVQIARYVNEHKPSHRVHGGLMGISLLCALPIIVVSESLTLVILFGVIMYLAAAVYRSVRLQALDVYKSGVAKFKRGDYLTAKNMLDKALMLDDRLADAYNYRGLAEHLSGKFSSAIEDFGCAIKLNPQNCEAYFNRGISRIKAGEYTAAISDFDHAITLDPKNAEAYYNRAIAESALHSYDWAIINFDRAIERKHAFADAYYRRGLAKEKRGDYAGAETDFEEACKIDPKYAAQMHKDRVSQPDEFFWRIHEVPASDHQREKAFDPKRASEEQKAKYYADILRLEGKVTIKAIKQCYKSLIAKCHPDKVQQLDEDFQKLADEKAKAINEAFEYFRNKYSF